MLRAAAAAADGDDDCSAVGVRGRTISAKGKLTVTPAPAIVIAGDCPLETGGGYTGFEHYLYRIEIASRRPIGALQVVAVQRRPDRTRHVHDGVAKTVHDQRERPGDQLLRAHELLSRSAQRNELGCWELTYCRRRDAHARRRARPHRRLGHLAGAGVDTFFRLWNGIALVTDFPTGQVDPKELKDGMRLVFEAPAADLSNYTPGDYWTFPVRAAGVPLRYLDVAEQCAARKASSSIACRSPRSTGRRTRPRATPTARSTIAGTSSSR